MITFLPLFIFPYFDGLHSDFSVFSSLFQKRSHCLQLLLHLTHILCCAKKLKDPSQSQAGGHIKVLIKHMYKLNFHHYFSSPVTCLVQASLHALTSTAQFLFLASSEIWEDFEQFQIALRGDIVMPRQLSKVLITLHGYHLVDLHTYQCLEKANQLRRDCSWFL